MTDYIKEAVRLADGWQFDSDEDGEFIQPSCTVISMYVDDLNEMPETYQFYLDALAVQLTRQVDALQNENGYGKVHSWPNYTEVTWWNAKGGDTICEAQGQDRTMNTIKAVVDSKVLEGNKDE